MSERTESNEASGPREGDAGGGGVADGGTSPATVAGPSDRVCGEAASHHLDCGSALRDLYGYLDGEITEERRAGIRVHIEECGPCLEAFDFEVELRQLVARTCQCDAPDALRERVAQALRECEDDTGGEEGG